LHDLLGAAIEKVEAGELAQPKPLLLHSSHLALKKVLKIKR
jgi:hypothetical protein